MSEGDNVISRQWQTIVFSRDKNILSVIAYIIFVVVIIVRVFVTVSVHPNLCHCISLNCFSLVVLFSILLRIKRVIKRRSFYIIFLFLNIHVGLETFVNRENINKTILLT